MLYYPIKGSSYISNANKEEINELISEYKLSYTCINTLEDNSPEKERLNKKFFEIFDGIDESLERFPEFKQKLPEIKPIQKSNEVNENRFKEIKDCKVLHATGHILLNANNIKENSIGNMKTKWAEPYKLSVPVLSSFIRGKTDAIFIKDIGDMFNYHKNVAALLEFKTSETLFKPDINQGLFELIGIY